jgi:pyruvate kinase
MPSNWTKTKIVCTIGPATSSKEVLRRLVMAGMNVARLNLAHDTQADHAARIDMIRSVSRKLKTPIGILLDLPGPKIRVGMIRPEPVVLTEGSALILTERNIVGNDRIVSVNPPTVLQELKKGDFVFLADGTIRLTVHQAKKHAVVCRVVQGGPLLSGKGVNLPGKKLGLRALTQRDVDLLRFGLENGADFIGLSFTTSQSDVVRAKTIVRQAGFRTWVIAKIETRRGVENFDEIVEMADGIMVARGDLGIEMEVEDVPVIQKRIIKKANAAGKPVVTATQMLESMVSNPTPTRAEVTDIANAIIDGTDAVMLSEETAVGRYPIEAVNVMRRVAAVTERSLPYRALLNSRRSLLRAIVQDSISFSACQVAYDLNAACIVAFTRAGATAHRVSKFRSSVPIIALTYKPRVMNRLSLLWGVYPHQVKKLTTTAQIFAAAKTAATKTKIVHAGDKIVVVCGDPSTSSGTTDLLRVETT